MSIWQIIRRLVFFVKPYSRWVVISLLLTLLGAFAAQVNPIVLRYTVDTIERLVREGRTASQGTSLLLLISAVLLGKEILNTGLRYGQNLFGEKIRVNVSSRLSQPRRKAEQARRILCGRAGEIQQERWEALAEADISFSRPALELGEAAAREMVDPQGLMGSGAGRDVLPPAGTRLQQTQ